MSVPPQTIYLACAADDFYAMPLGVTIYSALANLAPGYRIRLFVLDGGIRKANQRKLMESLDRHRIDIRWIRPSTKRLDALYHGSQSSYPLSAYLRLLLPELLPNYVKKVIYLDTDLIVTGNLAELWNIETKDAPLLAVQDAVHRFVKQAQHLQHLDLETMGITPDQKYLNSGVLVINIEKWRQERLADQVMNFMKQHPELPFPDQDGIAIVLAGQWQEIAPCWNQVHVLHHLSSWQESSYEQAMFEEAIDRPRIIHFTSRPKPWMPSCVHPKRHVFLHYLNQTAWSGWTTVRWNYIEQLIRRSIRKLTRKLTQMRSLYSA
jgi:lipopolysaccharide biosynthesis glycosyltransferase